MKLINCKRCGKLIVESGVPLCRDCTDELNKQYQIVRDYIHDYPRSNVTKISEETGVEEKTILQFLREGRLQLREEEDLGLYCQNCKRPIKVGRFCSRCASGIEKELKKGEKVAKRPIDRLTDRDSRMHIYDRLKGH